MNSTRPMVIQWRIAAPCRNRGVDREANLGGTLEPHRGVITTIAGDGANAAGTNPGWKRKASNVLAMRGKVDITPTLVITFSERDMMYEPPKQDEPMVISVVTIEYKVERVLINQGSSTNILYLSTYKRLGLQLANLETCSGKLYGFVGVIELETTFGKRSHVRTILVLYTVVDVDALYNIIMGRLSLNRLGAMVSDDSLFSCLARIK
ncbi:hypothetical protein CR513_07709, partial [Mucuna pruriens]